MNAVTLLARELRHLLFSWAFALLLPMCMLMAGGESVNSDIAVLYLALGAAWLAVEAFHPARLPVSVADWRARMAALALYLAVNAKVFSLFGTFAQIQSNIPLPLLATLGIAPSLGLVPWLVLRLRQPFTAIVLGAFTVAVIKLTTRVVYGLHYIALGCVSAAKLMVSLMLGRYARDLCTRVPDLLSPFRATAGQMTIRRQMRPPADCRRGFFVSAGEDVALKKIGETAGWGCHPCVQFQFLLLKFFSSSVLPPPLYFAVCG